MSGFFNNDRMSKYGYGTIRLLLVVLFSFCLFPSSVIDNGAIKNSLSLSAFPALPIFSFSSTIISMIAYYSSYRWLIHIYIGTIGAIVNVQITNLSINIFLLFIAGCLCIYDVITFDFSILIYLLKTFGGDYFAGKLDTVEWKLVLFFIFGGFTPFVFIYSNYYHQYHDHHHFHHDQQQQQHVQLLPSSSSSQQIEYDIYTMLSPYLRILLSLFLIQIICEFGDAHYEQYSFFRYRYSFEILTILLLLLLPNIQTYELMMIQYDLITCLFYRFSNFIIIIIQQLPNNILTNYGNMLLFSIAGLFMGRKCQRITNPEIATLIMKQSNHKGYALERHIALPAWYPILSLESIDGPLWIQLRKNFDLILKNISDSTMIQEIALQHMNQLMIYIKKNKLIIDANRIAKLTLGIMIEFLFGQECVEYICSDNSSNNSKLIHHNDRTTNSDSNSCSNNSNNNNRFNNSTNSSITISNTSNTNSSSSNNNTTTSTNNTNNNNSNNSSNNSNITTSNTHTNNTNNGSIMDILIQATWEWRKEISVRGKADMSIKNQTITILTDILLPYNSKLNHLFGDPELWKKSEYYSLLLQPFLISPTINTGDIMCAIQLHAKYLSLEQIIRMMHPFPIFERWVEKEVVLHDVVVVAANTQCIMFTNDFQIPIPSYQQSSIAAKVHTNYNSNSSSNHDSGDNNSSDNNSNDNKSSDNSSNDNKSNDNNDSTSESSNNNNNSHKNSNKPSSSSSSSSCPFNTTSEKSIKTNNNNNSSPYIWPWPIYGAGARSCAGMHLANPLLKTLHTQFQQQLNNDEYESYFQPQTGHKYSGRHLDGQILSMNEYIYFFRTIVGAIIAAGRESRSSSSSSDSS